MARWCAGFGVAVLSCAGAWGQCDGPGTWLPGPGIRGTNMNLYEKHGVGPGRRGPLGARLVVGGWFQISGNVPTAGVATQDFFSFLGAFFEGAASADVIADGDVDSQDFFDFVAEFFSGC